MLAGAHLSIEDCAKDGAEEFFTEMHCVRITSLLTILLDFDKRT